jgi:hypothetical protein
MFWHYEQTREDSDLGEHRHRQHQVEHRPFETEWKPAESIGTEASESERDQDSGSSNDEGVHKALNETFIRENSLVMSES